MYFRLRLVSCFRLRWDFIVSFSCYVDISSFEKDWVDLSSIWISHDFMGDYYS